MHGAVFSIGTTQTTHWYTHTHRYIIPDEIAMIKHITVSFSLSIIYTSQVLYSVFSVYKDIELNQRISSSCVYHVTWA